MGRVLASSLRLAPIALAVLAVVGVPAFGQAGPALPALGIASHPRQTHDAGASDGGMRHRGPWMARRRSGVHVVDAANAAFLPPAPGALDRVRLRALGLRGGERTRIAPERWPQEPQSPRHPAPGRFAAALGRLCPKGLPAERLQAISDATLDAAREFSVDPFLLAALVYNQSACGTLPPDSWGVGLTRINVGMHRGHVLGGVYRYGAPASGGGFERRELVVDAYPLEPLTLRRPGANLYFAAAFLRVFGEQCPHIDRPFGSTPHRHPVSHFVWGDHVRSAGAEDLIMIARRRLVGYYTGKGRPLRALYRGLSLSSPLDGAPRVATGLMGDPREGGKRVHAGIDLHAAMGEPVRAMAPGRVQFAGVELKRKGMRELPPERALVVPPSRMGVRGLYVRIDHGDGVSTLYVHLSEYLVRSGQRVKRGQVIGYVGRTGVHTSDAHLHLGLFDRDRVLDPLPHLQPLVLAGDGIPILDYTMLGDMLSGASRRP
ncbi:MAG: M23 family metallopeptidase [Myxococcales bacterium]